MTGRTISEFITELYNNPEMEFIYHSNRYMISGYVSPSGDIYTLELWNISTNNLREKCVEQFEASKLFDNRTIYEAEDEITVQYG